MAYFDSSNSDVIAKEQSPPLLLENLHLLTIDFLTFKKRALPLAFPSLLLTISFLMNLHFVMVIGTRSELQCMKTAPPY